MTNRGYQCATPGCTEIVSLSRERDIGHCLQHAIDVLEESIQHYKDRLETALCLLSDFDCFVSKACPLSATYIDEGGLSDRLDALWAEPGGAQRWLT